MLLPENLSRLALLSEPERNNLTLLSIKRALALLSLLFVVAGCGDSNNEFVFTGTAPNVALTSITVAPATAAIVDGETLQYTATATFSNGTQQVATNEVAWTSSNPAAATISATGLATGQGQGETTITASLNGVSGQATLTVADLANIYAVDDQNNLVAFQSDQAGNPATYAIEGLAAGDDIVGVDFRPQNGYLYGLAFNDGTGDLTLYNIAIQTAPAPNATSVFATAVGAANADVFAPGTTFGFDFNPSVDRIRIVSSDGRNLRMNPNTGAYVQPDGDLNGEAENADGAAYTNSVPNTTATTLYVIDSVTGSIYLQNPPNDGTLTDAVVVTENGVDLPFTGVGGFDIASNVSVAANNAAVTSGQATAILTVDGASYLYAIDLVTGEASNYGEVAGNPIRALAVRTLQTGNTAVALDAAGTGLLRFNTNTPGTTNAAGATLTFAAGEVLAGLDWRPANGQLYALGVNAATDTATLYVVDPQTGGALTPVGGANGLVSFTGVDLPDPNTSGYGFDFNPTVDRIRVVTGSGLNLRLNPVTGTAVDADPGTAGTQPDGALNGGTTSADGAAYTNSFATAPTEGVTTLYVIDALTNSLYLQNPPNAGTEVLQDVITLGGSTLDFNAVNGFDIRSDVTVTTANAAVTSGSALALLQVAGDTGLYSINLTDGVATLVAGNLSGVRALAVGL